jgi:hypothetical protein
MLRSILFSVALIGIGGAIVLAIANGHAGVLLIASAFFASLAVSAITDDLRLVPPEAAAPRFSSRRE